MKDNITIAVFSSNWLGVSETFIYRQLVAIGDNGLNSIVLSQNIKDSKLKSEYDGLVYLKKMDIITFLWGVVMRKFKCLKNGWFASFPQQKYWHKALKDNHVRLIHAHYGPGGLRVLNTAQKLNIPLITTFHGNDASAAIRKRGYKESLQELFKYSYIITVSEFLRKRLISLGAPADKVIKHYIGTNLQQFCYTEHISVEEKAKRREKINFLQVSNFVEKKGHFYTIHAFAQFLMKYNNAELIFAGDGVLKEDMELLVEKLGIANKVSFLGAVGPPKVSELMSTCDVFLHHSVTGSDGSEEGIPTVIMEAMASGIPVVTTYHAGIPELVDTDCGFLVNERDIKDYSDVLSLLLSTDTKHFAKKACQKVHDQFDVKKQNDLLIQLYHQIINGNFS